MEIKLTQHGMNVQKFSKTEAGKASIKEYEKQAKKVEKAKEWATTPEGRKIIGSPKFVNFSARA